MCALYLSEEETLNHLFIHCPVVYKVSKFFFAHLDVPWVFPFDFKGLIFGWWIVWMEVDPKAIWRYFSSALC